jgi:ribosome-associated toxin RatA of RatAB toxin-antitoxin module
VRRRLRMSARLLRRCTLTAVLALPCAAPGFAQQMSVHTERHGEEFRIKAMATIAVDTASAWSVLTDYARFAQFIPGVLESRVVSREGAKVVVEQRGEANWLFLSFPMQVRLAVEEFPFERIESSLISGNFKSMQGVYNLLTAGDRLQLHYEGSFTPDFSLPPLIGTLMVRSMVEARFKAMVKEIEKTRPPVTPAAQ